MCLIKLSLREVPLKEHNDHIPIKEKAKINTQSAHFTLLYINRILAAVPSICQSDIVIITPYLTTCHLQASPRSDFARRYSSNSR